MLTIAKNAKKYQEKFGISQDKLSKLAGLSLNTIVKIELNDSHNPAIENIQRIAKTLDTTKYIISYNYFSSLIA